MKDEPLIARLFDNEGRFVSSAWIAIPADALVIRIDSHAVWQADSGKPARLTAYRFMLWHSVEQIAAYVRGFSDDPVCSVIADAILEGRR